MDKSKAAADAVKLINQAKEDSNLLRYRSLSSI